MVVIHKADALQSLLTAHSSADLLTVVDELERQRHFRWVALGGIEGNYGLVNIGSEPGLAFVERITNAVDAVVERAAQDARVALVNPRAAAEQLFGIADGRIVRAGDTLRAQLARNIIVSVNDGRNKDHPTLEVRDFGIGIAPDQFAQTILSLARSNKVNKPYLCGAYGQGGSTTLAFCDSTLIAAAAEHGDVGVTVVRFNELDPRTNKNGRYEYLVDGRGKVPAIARSEIDFQRGTLVRHYNYAFKAHSGLACARRESMAHLCSAALFDPLLPITIEERRERFATADAQAPAIAIFTGSSARLAEAPAGAIQYRQSVRLSLQRKRQYGDAWVHYAVLAQADGGQPPAAEFVDPAYPILMTYFGQTHGRESRRFIADDLRLPFLKPSLIVQVEFDGLTPLGRRELLSSTRDRLKRGNLYEHVLEVVGEALREDQSLVRLNAERRQQLLTKQSAVEEERIRKRFVELMDRYRAGVDTKAGSRDGDRRSTVPAAHANGGGDPREPVAPISTAAKPTFLRVAGRVPLKLQLDRHAIVTLESDAPDAFLVQHPAAKLALIDDPAGRLEMVRHTDFRAGRARATLRLTGGLPNDRGTVTLYVIGPDDVALDAPVPYVITDSKPEERGGKDGRSGISVPRIEGVYRERWPFLEWHEGSVAQVMTSNDRTVVYVNLDNRHLQRLIARAGYQEQGLARLKNNYLVYVAFYAFLQNRHDGDVRGRVDEAALDAYLEAEFDRVAQTVIFSLSSAERAEALVD